MDESNMHVIWWKTICLDVYHAWRVQIVYMEPVIEFERGRVLLATSSRIFLWIY